jgi:hypothetical protein
MRYRLMATYRGVPYEAGIGPSDDDVVLFAACPPPEELGFEPATGHWRKQLRIKEVQALWESRPLGTFRGDRCIVLDDLGDRLHIAYQGHDAFRAAQLGYWEVDRGVFELVAPREEVSEIVEERLDYPHRSADAAPGPQPAESATLVPPARDAAATAPRLTGPLPAAPNSAGPELTGPHAAVPGARAPHLTGPLPAVPNSAVAGQTGPHAAVRNSAVANLTGPHAAVRNSGAPDLTGPHAAVSDAGAPHLTGPLPAVPNSAAPHTTGPLPAASNSAGPNMTGPLPAVPGAADTSPDLAVIPPSSAPPLPLEAAARRAASARVLQPAPVPESVLAPQPAPQPGPQAAAPSFPASRKPEPARARRAALRRQATQRIFSELAGLAAIPPSAYAVGEEVDGAMCLIQTPDGFEVFNAAGGARHEVRIFDDEESAYFYLFGVLAAEAVRTGRLAPQG